MTAGDSVTDYDTVANGQYLTIRPDSGAEWRIENIYCGGAWTLYIYDGTTYTEVLRGNKAEKIPPERLGDVINYTQYFMLKNSSGSSANFGYSGVVWK